jgi:hypothetical protein
LRAIGAADIRYPRPSALPEARRRQIDILRFRMAKQKGANKVKTA